MDLKSRLGYRDNSPYRNNPYLDINTPDGSIDMSDTNIPLIGIDNTGMAKVLLPKSGMHKFRGNKVREIRMQQGGFTQADLLDFIFSEDEEIAEVPPTPNPEPEIETQAPEVEDTSEYDAAMAIAMEDSPYTALRERRSKRGVRPRSLNFAGIESTSAIPTNDKAQFAMQYYQNKGIQPHIAAGIVGNLMQESGLNPYAKGDAGKARGIAQWHPDRFKGLENWAGKQKRNPYALETQLDYILAEPGESSKVLQALGTARDSGEAAVIFDKVYERSAGLHTKQRVGYARSLHPYKYGGKI